MVICYYEPPQAVVATTSLHVDGLAVPDSFAARGGIAGPLVEGDLDRFRV